MFLGIPAISTIKEYERLKETQQPIKLTENVTEMDKFVREKYNKFSNAKALAWLGVLNAIPLFTLKKSDLKAKLNVCAGAALLDLFCVGLIKFNLMKKENELKYINCKKFYYQKAGLNVRG